MANIQANFLIFAPQLAVLAKFCALTAPCSDIFRLSGAVFFNVLSQFNFRYTNNEILSFR